MSVKTSEAVVSQLEMNTEVSADFNTVAGEMQEISNLISSISAAAEQQLNASTHIIESIEAFKQDTEILDEESNTMVRSIGGILDAVEKIEHAASVYKKGDSAAMFIRAKLAHAAVLKTIQLAVVSGRSDTKIPDHASCMFGKVYYSKEYQEKFGRDSDFKAIEAPHKEVHKYADIMADAIRKGDANVQAKLKEFCIAVDGFKTAINRMIAKLS
jgi:methyl-accepting chemotaxis protein